MNLLAPDPDPTDPARLDLEVERVCDRLRTMSLVRLAAPLHGPTPGIGAAPVISPARAGGASVAASRAGAARILAQELADLTAQLAGQQPRTLPDLPDASAADLLAVCGHDLSAEVRRQGGAAAQACARAVEGLVGLRLLL